MTYIRQTVGEATRLAEHAVVTRGRTVDAGARPAAKRAAAGKPEVVAVTWHVAAAASIPHLAMGMFLEHWLRHAHALRAPSVGAAKPTLATWPALNRIERRSQVLLRQLPPHAHVVDADRRRPPHRAGDTVGRRGGRSVLRQCRHYRRRRRRRCCTCNHRAHARTHAHCRHHHTLSCGTCRRLAVGRGRQLYDDTGGPAGVRHVDTGARRLWHLRAVHVRGTGALAHQNTRAGGEQSARRTVRRRGHTGTSTK